jgi:hypothetical protein
MSMPFMRTGTPGRPGITRSNPSPAKADVTAADVKAADVIATIVASASDSRMGPEFRYRFQLLGSLTEPALSRVKAAHENDR